MCRSSVGYFGAATAAFLVLAGCSGNSETAASSTPSTETSPAGNQDSAGPSQAGMPTLFDASTAGETELSPSNACAEVKVAATRPPVDVILVIDSSSSMVDEIAQVKANINSFANSIGKAGIDYRVVMIAKRGKEDTSMCVPPPLANPDCADNPPRFFHSDIWVSSKEHLYRILTTYDDSDATRAWNNRIRKDSVKIMIAISDDNSYLESKDFEKRLFAKEPAGMFGDVSARNYVFHSICGWDETTAPLSSQHCATAMNNGEDFQRLSLLTGGIVDSVCKTDYSLVLRSIAKDVIKRVGCKFHLPTPTSRALDFDRVVVRYQSGTGGSTEAFARVTDVSKCAQWDNGWYYDNNASPSTVLLCPEACAKVQGDDNAALEILVGCKAVVPK